MSLGKYTIKGSVEIGDKTIDGYSKDVHITGLPYSVSMDNISSLPSGWNGANIAWSGYGNGVGDGRDVLRLRGNSKTNQADNGWVVSPQYHIPSSVDVDVNVIVTNYLYHGKLFSTSTGYLYVDASSGSYSSSTTSGVKKTGSRLFYNQATFSDDKFSATMTSSKPRITVYANNFGDTSSIYFTVKNIMIQYK